MREAELGQQHLHQTLFWRNMFSLKTLRNSETGGAAAVGEDEIGRVVEARKGHGDMASA